MVYQSYQSWVLLRPAIESALIMGRWLDNFNNFEVWKDHPDSWKNYKNIYQGKNLVSDSLPKSTDIQNVLKHINDDFMHTNPSYYQRHSQIVDLNEKNVEMVYGLTNRSTAKFLTDSNFVFHQTPCIVPV